jgi:hypothetical protein
LTSGNLVAGRPPDRIDLEPIAQFVNPGFVCRTIVLGDTEADILRNV